MPNWKSFQLLWVDQYEIPDVLSGDIIGRVLQGSGGAIIARKDSVFIVDQKDRHIKRIKCVKKKRSCAVYKVDHFLL